MNSATRQDLGIQPQQQLQGDSENGELLSLGLDHLRLLLREDQAMNTRLLQPGRFGLRALCIAASVASIIALLRNDWTGGISVGVDWLVFAQVERRLLPPAAEASEP